MLKDKILYNKIWLQAAVCFLLVMAIGSTGWSKEIKKVAVLPFLINSQDDLTFLQKGIFDMFSTRISYPEEVDVLTREQLEQALADYPGGFTLGSGVNEAKAKSLGQFIKVDHVLFGSLTLFGKSMSLDVNMVDIKAADPALTFYRQGEDPGSVIPELNKIAEEINFKVFGRETEEFQSMMAMRNLNQNAGVNYASPLDQFLPIVSVQGRLNGICVADTDGDKKNETIIVQRQSIAIYDYSANRKISLAHTIETSSLSQNIHVASADMDRDGYAEIFVTQINNTNETVKSIVVEYDGSQYVQASQDYPWYLNVITDQTGSEVLVAQVHRQSGPWDSSRVFKVIPENSGYTLGDKFRVPEQNFSVLSLVRGKTSDDVQAGSYMYIDSSGRLTMVNADTGAIEWTSEKGYGGSDLYYRITDKEVNALYRFVHVFFQPQGNFFDMDDDGKTELFVIRNIESSGYLLKNTRTFRTGSIEMLSTNAMGGFSPQKAAKRVPGPVTSIFIGDYDNDAKMELLVSVVKSNDSLISMSDKECILGVYELE